MAWECTLKAERKRDILTARLIREDKRLPEAEENATFFALQIPMLELKQNSHKPEKDAKGKKADRKKKIEELKKRTKYFFKEKGHWVRECPKKTEGGESGGSQPAASVYICDVTALYLSTTDSDKDVWLADSGASIYMTFRRDFFNLSWAS